jgi:hypothetical protein
MLIAMSANFDFKNLAICAALVTIFAAGRFTRLQDRDFGPLSRSTTTAFRFYRSLSGYLTFTLMLLVGLSSVPLAFATGGQPIPAELEGLPPIYVSALLLTVALPNFRFLRVIDEWIRGMFYEWAEIPAQARQLRQTLITNNHAIPVHLEGEVKEQVGVVIWELNMRGDPLAHRLIRCVALVKASQAEFADPPRELQSELNGIAERVRNSVKRFQTVESVRDTLRTTPALAELDRTLRDNLQETDQRVHGILAQLVLGYAATYDRRRDVVHALGFDISQWSDDDSPVLQVSSLIFLLVFISFIVVLISVRVPASSANAQPFVDIVFKAVSIALSYVAATSVPMVVARRHQSRRKPGTGSHKPALWVWSGLVACFCSFLLQLFMKISANSISQQSLEVGAREGVKEALAKSSYLIVTGAVAVTISCLIDVVPTMKAHGLRHWGMRLLDAGAVSLASLAGSWVVIHTLQPLPTSEHQMMATMASIGAILGFLVPHYGRVKT